MASLDTDINMVPAGEGSSGAVGPSAAASSSTSKKPKRFEIKKWNAVALWAWGMCPIHKRLAVRVDSLVLDETRANAPSVDDAIIRCPTLLHTPPFREAPNSGGFAGPTTQMAGIDTKLVLRERLDVR
ncbi:hypothetical protein B296_00018517 [Ensete ventricosum]|uniref:Uncharacterized protein n=1 Tax=Ensete ventricosum TaxID=4639 RepID=A0A427B3R6_ENSVE|nr:hypothetical protein B296_00018517 [Ensete ventricosum]